MEKNYLEIRKNAIFFLKSIMGFAFPNHAGISSSNIKSKKEEEFANAKKYLSNALTFLGYSDDEKNDILKRYFAEVDNIIEILHTDIEAGYVGDPAAESIDEVIICYPAFIAIGSYRFAHILYTLGVKIIPRIMTEYAHGKTGIDIHPGATIGKSFFIDHGTGVVIGETTVIGDNVKLYQNVTLGAKSFSKNPDGSLVKGIKRHPNVGNNVVIYAGATILGGDTYIGDNAIIGGNTWITESVAANEKVITRK